MPRRLTTILAADIAGFSRLVGIDEEGTLADQRAHRTKLIDPLLEKFGGRVANTAGDSLLIEFPSAVEAVRCAVAVQGGMAARTVDTPEGRRIAYRIGINVGDVVPEGDDLLGDGVNVAARLESLALPGGIVLSRTARDQVRDRLDLDLADLGEVELKNIVRPVRVFQVLRAGEAPMQVPTPPRRRLPTVVVAALVLGAVIASGVYWQSQRESVVEDSATAVLPLPDKFSIVVLPFTNLSSEAGQDYFVDGFTRAVTTNLSKFPQMFVIAASTASTYKGKSVRARDVGRDVGVGYLLEGSVQRDAKTVTVNAQLIETESERTVWAEQYVFPPEDPFTVQSKLIKQIAGTLRFAIEDEAIAKVQRRPTDSPRAYDMFLRALAASKSLSKGGRVEAIRLLNRAIELEPDFLDAHFALSSHYLSIWRFGGVEDPDEALRLARLHAESALRIDRTDYRGHFRLGMLYLFADHEHELAYAAFKRALDHNPNDADILYNMGFLRSLMGEGTEAITWNNKAKRINPRYPGWYNFNAALSHYWVKDYERAILLAKTGIAAYPKVLAPRRILIATLVEMGRMEEATKEVADYLAIRPNFRLSTFRNTPFQNPADQDRYFNALRKGGLPD